MDGRIEGWHTAIRALTASIIDCRGLDAAVMEAVQTSKSGDENDGASSERTRLLREALSLAFEAKFDYVATDVRDVEAAVSILESLEKEAATMDKEKIRNGEETPDRPPPPLVLACCDGSSGQGSSTIAQEKQMLLLESMLLTQKAAGVILKDGTNTAVISKAEALSVPVIIELDLPSAVSSTGAVQSSSEAGGAEGLALSLDDIKSVKNCLSASHACDTLLLQREDGVSVAGWVAEAAEATKFADSESPLLWPKAPSPRVWTHPGEQHKRNPMAELEVVARATVAVAGESAAAMILAITRSGQIAHMLSKYRPGVPIMAFTDSLHIARRLNVRRGIFALSVDKKDVAEISDHDRPGEALRIAKEMGWVSGGDKVVIVTAGEDIDPALADGTVSMRVVTLSEFDGPLFI
mmetsp:Transcript_23533/g.37801  ORF Transcript_23533/g.37801 Transcript_23533/m.37801 type:complete len:409 (+) Transcript_23533:74-1300(+)